MPEHDRSGARAEFLRFLRRVQLRWRGRRALDGVLWTLALLGLAVFVAVYVMVDALFEPALVESARMAVYGLGAVALLVLVAPRVLRGMTEPEAAEALERQAPELDALLLSATELAARERASSLDDRVIEQALAAARERPAVWGFEQDRLRRTAIGVLTVVIAGLALTAFVPPTWQHGLGLIFDPERDPRQSTPLEISVLPGDTEAVQGDELKITASAVGFSAGQLLLSTRERGTEAWSQTEMVAAPEGHAFDALLFDLQRSLEYRVETGPVASAVFEIEVLPHPRVSRIDLLYRYPAVTGRAAKRVEDGGDIHAVSGTHVEIEVVPDRPALGGELVLDGERRVVLERRGDRFVADLEVDSADHYRVELSANGVAMRPSSPEYSVTTFDDRRPRLVIDFPGRDREVTAIEEVTFDVSASDDVGLRAFELVLSVNGGPDEVIELGSGPFDDASITEARGAHLMMLESLQLAPGDMIAYYARARDGDGDGREVATDIFFLDVRPFERRFREAGGGGGGGGGGGRGGQGGGDSNLSAQQRSLVVALFKLQRDEASHLQAEFEEKAAVLKDAQGRIRQRVDAIARRLGTRSMTIEDTAYDRMAQELPQASAKMLEVESMLLVSNVDQALLDARDALLHLQRADAAFRDIRVAMARQGRGGAQAAANNLSNLFRLEMDKFRNQYEEVQRAGRDRQAQSLDETLRKLEELARRQQRELERSERRRAGRRSGGAASQQALAEQLEQLVRQLERLTRERPSEPLQRSLDALRNARESMKKAGEQGQTQAAREALDRIEEARRQIDSDRSAARLTRQLEQARQRLDAIEAEQEKLIERVTTELSDETPAGEHPEEIVEDLQETKYDMVKALRALEKDLDGAERQALRERASAARSLEETNEWLRERNLIEKVEVGARRLERESRTQSLEWEGRLKRDFDRLSARLDDAVRAVAENAESARAGELERLRSLVRRMSREARGEAGAGSGQKEAEGAERTAGKQGSDQASDQASDRAESAGEQTAPGRQAAAAEEGRGRGEQASESRAGGRQGAAGADGQGRGREGERTARAGQESPGGRAPGAGGQGGGERRAGRGGFGGGRGSWSGQPGQGGYPPGGDGGPTGSGLGNADGQSGRYDIDLGDLRQRMTMDLRTLERLQALFEQLPTEGRDIGALVDTIRDSVASDDATGLELAQRRGELLELLKRAEHELRNGSGEGEGIAAAMPGSEPDAANRDLVEAYFRSLSEGRDETRPQP